MTIGLPPAVAHLLELLWQEGYRAYVVGGCVRDSLMGRAPQDWDIATSARPDQAARCFAGLPVLETGLRHGTITVLWDHAPYEVTTFRRDGAYTDHRRPDRVEFVDSLTQDLARRDFTINALAYHPGEGVIDRFGGIEDIRRRRILCVGDAVTRFREDALRILRGVRFAATLDFTVETATASAMVACAPLLSNVAPERLRVELDKTLLGPAAARCMGEHRAVMAHLLPELSPVHWTEGLKALEHTPPMVSMKLAALLQGIDSESVLNRLPYDNRTKREVLELIDGCGQELVPARACIARWLNRLGEPGLRRQLQFRRALCMAGQESVHDIDQLESMVDKLLNQGLCYRIDQLKVDGHDLMAAGLPPGKPVGDCLRTLLDKVMDGDLVNQRDALLQEALLALGENEGRGRQ